MEPHKSSETAEHQIKPSVSRAGWFWLGGMFAVVALSKLLETFDRSTTLVPMRADAIYMAIVFALLLACLSVIVGVNETSGPPWTKFTCGVLAFGMVGFLAPFMLLSQISSLFFARIDFSPDKVRTFNALLPIGRTWHSKPRRSPESFTIQPTPLWSNIDIAREDWNFMLAELKLNDDPERDDIPSNGRFCARVRMQQAGPALRVLNAGSHALPKGSVILCPPETDGLPFLEIS
ncbi:hypothetical protein [Novosphingobium sp.]|uniref:hypothetical protein n=1 Tax=Novosphingobium sp. TaxID=1874826 RepID=UPI00286D64AE|nr:hypothetical protein [Novosphingobium sp.]